MPQLGLQTKSKNLINVSNTVIPLTDPPSVLLPRRCRLHQDPEGGARQQVQLGAAEAREPAQELRVEVHHQHPGPHQGFVPLAANLQGQGHRVMEATSYEEGKKVPPFFALSHYDQMQETLNLEPNATNLES